MDHLQKFAAQVRMQLLVMLLVNNVVIIAVWWVAADVFDLANFVILFIISVISILLMAFIPILTSKFITEPTRLIWQAILHIAPDVANAPAPNLKKLTIGHELVTYLV